MSIKCAEYRLLVPDIKKALIGDSELLINIFFEELIRKVSTDNSTFRIFNE